MRPLASARTARIARLARAAALVALVACGSRQERQDPCEWDSEICGGPRQARSVTDPDDTTPKLKIDANATQLLDNEDFACVTVDDGAAFWVNRDGRIAAISTRTDTTRMAPPTYASFHTDKVAKTGACGLLRDGDDLYVTRGESGAIARLSVRRDGRGDVTLGDVALDSAIPYAIGAAPSALAADADALYVADLDTGAIQRLPRRKSPSLSDAGASDAGASDGGAPEAGAATPVVGSLGASGHSVKELVVDDRRVYWFGQTSTKFELHAVPKTGGSIVTVATVEAPSIGLNNPKQLRVLAGALYWVASGELWTVPTEGGLPPARVMTPGTYVDAIAVAESQLLAAVGPQIRPLTGLSPPAFTYRDDESRYDIVFFAQGPRVVWARGDSMYTKLVGR